MYVCTKEVGGKCRPKMGKNEKRRFRVLKDDNAEVERQDEECTCIRSRITIASFHRASNADGRVSRGLEYQRFVP